MIRMKTRSFGPHEIQGADPKEAKARRARIRLAGALFKRVGRSALDGASKKQVMDSLVLAAYG